MKNFKILAESRISFEEEGGAFYQNSVKGLLEWISNVQTLHVANFTEETKKKERETLPIAGDSIQVSSLPNTGESPNKGSEISPLDIFQTKHSMPITSKSS